MSINAIMWNEGEKSLIYVWLRGDTSTTYAPAAAGNWGVGLGTQVGGVGVSNPANKAKTMSSLLEVDGTNSPPGNSGYARQSIVRSGSGWVSTDPMGAGSWSVTGTEASFAFSTTPVPTNGTLWFVAANTSINADNALFGADLSATRPFVGGDAENVTPTYMQT